MIAPKRPLTLIILPFVLIATGSFHARAVLILDFSPDGSVASFTVPLGGTVAVPVYLRQLSVMTPDITTDGLTDFGLTGTLSGGTATFTAADADSAFEFDVSSVGTTTSADLVGSTNTAQTGSAIRLGSFTVMGNTVGDTTLTLSDTNPGAGVQDFLTESLAANFDADVFSPVASTTISTVPEPSSFLFLGVIGVLIVAAANMKSRWLCARTRSAR